MPALPKLRSKRDLLSRSVITCLCLTTYNSQPLRCIVLRHPQSQLCHAFEDRWCSHIASQIRTYSFWTVKATKYLIGTFEDGGNIPYMTHAEFYVPMTRYEDGGGKQQMVYQFISKVRAVFSGIVRHGDIQQSMPSNSTTLKLSQPLITVKTHKTSTPGLPAPSPFLSALSPFLPTPLPPVSLQLDLDIPLGRRPLAAAVPARAGEAAPAQVREAAPAPVGEAAPAPVGEAAALAVREAAPARPRAAAPARPRPAAPGLAVVPRPVAAALALLPRHGVCRLVPGAVDAAAAAAGLGCFALRLAGGGGGGWRRGYGERRGGVVAGRGAGAAAAAAAGGLCAPRWLAVCRCWGGWACASCCGR